MSRKQRTISQSHTLVIASLALAAVVSACVASPDGEVEDQIDETAAGAQAQTDPVAPITTGDKQDAMDVGEMKSLAIPRGSYRNSCKNSHVRGSTLYSTCKRRNGTWHNTKLADYLECGADDIYNNNGNLGCVVPG